MGATIFYHSKDWLAASQEIKSRISSGSSLSSSNIRMGVGINNAKVSGSILIPIVDHREFLAEFPAAFEQIKSGEICCAGVSHYHFMSYIGMSRLAGLPSGLDAHPSRGAWKVLPPQWVSACALNKSGPPSSRSQQELALLWTRVPVQLQLHKSILVWKSPQRTYLLSCLFADFDLPAIHSLFDGIDFVGISAYIPLPDPYNFTVRRD